MTVNWLAPMDQLNTIVEVMRLLVDITRVFDPVVMQAASVL